MSHRVIASRCSVSILSPSKLRGSRSSLSEINALKSFCIRYSGSLSLSLACSSFFFSISFYYFYFYSTSIFCINAVSFLAWLDWFIQCDQNIVWVLCAWVLGVFVLESHSFCLFFFFLFILFFLFCLFAITIKLNVRMFEWMICTRANEYIYIQSKSIIYSTSMYIFSILFVEIKCLHMLCGRPICSTSTMFVRSLTHSTRLLLRFVLIVFSVFFI